MVSHCEGVVVGHMQCKTRFGVSSESSSLCTQLAVFVKFRAEVLTFLYQIDSDWNLVNIALRYVHEAFSSFLPLLSSSEKTSRLLSSLKVLVKTVPLVQAR